MTDAEHSISIQELGGAWQRDQPLLQATCSCGWEGKRDFMPRDVAEADARQHLARAEATRDA